MVLCKHCCLCDWINEILYDGLVLCYSSHWIKIKVVLGLDKPHLGENFVPLLFFGGGASFLHVYPSFILSANQDKRSPSHFIMNFSSFSLLLIILIVNLMGFRILMEMNLWAYIKGSLQIRLIEASPWTWVMPSEGLESRAE